MNIKIKNYIPDAFKIIEDYENSLDAKPIDKELKGYISSLGASILMSGLIPTLAIYAAEDSNSQASRFIILDWIYQLIRNEKNEKPIDNAKAFFQYALSLDPQGQNSIEHEILDASIALKLCLRTFELSK
jgi:hypothetical protein